MLSGVSRFKEAYEMTTVTVTSAAELLDALAAADDIEVDGSLAGTPATCRHR